LAPTASFSPTLGSQSFKFGCLDSEMRHRLGDGLMTSLFANQAMHFKGHPSIGGVSLG
jgi:hypothetical protein